MEFNENLCRCEAPPECPEVESTDCPNGQRFDRVTCQCIDICDVKCNEPKSLDFITCKCDCPPSSILPGFECPGLQQFDEDTCKCMCAHRNCSLNEVSHNA